MATPLADRLASVQSAISDATREAGRPADEITTVVVTKFHSASLVRELAGLGVRDFGESRHQEAQPKIAELADLDAIWHFIGQLQSKKARAVREYVDVVHSLDRESLVTDGAPVDVFIQVNLTDDPERGGVAPSGLDSLAELVAAESSLNLLGLMAVAPLGSQPRGEFERVRLLSERGAKDRACGIRAVDGHVRGFSRSDFRRRDTPTNWHGNHGKSTRTQLTSVTGATPVPED